MLMRYKDFVLKQAIKEAYNIYINNMTASKIGQIYIRLSSKLGFKVVDEAIVSNIKPTSSTKNFVDKCERYKNEVNGKCYRYLDYNLSKRKTLYFDEDGNLYEYDYHKYHSKESPYVFLPKEGNEDSYGTYEELLNFSKMYYKELKKNKIQYLMVGYDDKHYYYTGSDSKAYYKNSPLSTTYIECTPSLLNTMLAITGKTFRSK